MDFSGTIHEARPNAVRSIRTFVGNYLGHSAATVTSYGTCATPPTLSNVADWSLVLKALEAELGLPFSSSDADRIGCFEKVDLQLWLAEPTPFLIEAIPPNSETAKTAGVRQLQVSRSIGQVETRQRVHITCYSDARTVVDRFLVLEPTQRRSSLIASPHPVDRLEFSVFNDRGDLLHREEVTFLKTIHTTMGLQGGTLVLEDDLARRANSHTKKGDDPSGKVMSVSHERMVTSFASTNEHWLRHASRMNDVRKSCFPPNSNDRWFSRTLDDELGVIAHFDKLLSGGTVRAAVLVDPFFAADALVRFLLRLTSRDVKLTVITSWTSTDPDTGEVLTDRAAAVADLRSRLRGSISQFVNPSLSVINLANGIKQAFHDRYLLLYPREGEPQVYLLSNSINAMAANWPFCMSLLADDVRPQAQQYIEGLTQGVDVTGSTKPQITFRWPEDA
jgi:hypothetical protein